MTPAHAGAFDRADAYDAHATVQAEVAAWLADVLRALPRPARMLEIGCGTGFVRAAAGDIADDWLATDIAPAMLDRARARLAGERGLRFASLDGEHPALDEPPFDLVAGSLVVQWFDDLASGLDRLFAYVAPGGRLVVTTLAAGSFAEWTAAHEGEGLAPGTRPFLAVETLAALRPGGVAPELTTRRFRERHGDGRAFLRALKAIGAGTPRPGHRPLPPAALRRVLRRWEAQGATICYAVAMLTFTKPAR